MTPGSSPPLLAALFVRLLDFGASRSWGAIPFRYGLAVILVLAAHYLRLVLAPVGDGLQYVTFFPAVALASMAAGLGPGLLATALGGVLATITFATPTWSLLVFLFDGMIVSLAAEVMRRYARSYRSAVAQLEGANRAKSEFLAGMSHELRTPLNAVIGFSEIGRARALGSADDKLSEYFTDIHDAGQHLLDLVNDLLDISVIESGKAVLNEQAFELGATLDACATVMSVRASQAGVTLQVSAPQAIRIRADDRRIKQVVLNLLANAVDFTPEGGEVTLSAGAASGGGVFVSVRDTGIGMDADTLARVSQPFGGVGRSKRHKESAGLGLTVTRFLIELHGGRLELVSQLGEGTVATLLLPKERVLDTEPGPDGGNPLYASTIAGAVIAAKPEGSARSREWLPQAAATRSYS